MLAREIKDLSFALEALARVADASVEYGSVKQLLQDKISALQMEIWPSMKVPSAQLNLDDDIPF